MTVSSADLKQLVREALLADAALVALVDDRAFGQHLSDADAGTVLDAGPMVVYELLSGFARYPGIVATQTLDVYGYSKRSQDESNRVYDQAFAVLQAGKLSVNGLAVCGLARETQRPDEGFNDQVRAWFTRGRWLITVTQ